MAEPSTTIAIVAASGSAIAATISAFAAAYSSNVRSKGERTLMQMQHELEKAGKVERLVFEDQQSSLLAMAKAISCIQLVRDEILLLCNAPPKSIDRERFLKSIKETSDLVRALYDDMAGTARQEDSHDIHTAKNLLLAIRTNCETQLMEGDLGSIASPDEALTQGLSEDRDLLLEVQNRIRDRRQWIIEDALRGRE